jgi:hypothetical protein
MAVGNTPFYKITMENALLSSRAEFPDDMHDGLENRLAFTVRAGWLVGDFEYRNNVAVYCALDGSRAFPMIAATAKLGVGDPFLMTPLPYGYFRGKRAEADYGGRSSTWQTGIE